MKTAEGRSCLLGREGQEGTQKTVGKAYTYPCLTFHSVQVDHFNKNEKVVYYYCCLCNSGARARGLVIAGQVLYQQATLIVH